MTVQSAISVGQVRLTQSDDQFGRVFLVRRIAAVRRALIAGTNSVYRESSMRQGRHGDRSRPRSISHNPRLSILDAG